MRQLPVQKTKHRGCTGIWKNISWKTSENWANISAIKKNRRADNSYKLQATIILLRWVRFQRVLDMHIDCSSYSLQLRTYTNFLVTLGGCFWKERTSCFLLLLLQSSRKLALSLCSPFTFVARVLLNVHPPPLKLVPKKSSYFVWLSLHYCPMTSMWGTSQEIFRQSLNFNAHAQK